MTLPVSDTAAGLAPASSALEPAWVRHGSAAVQQDYQVALGFEDMLLNQLTSSLGQSGEGAGESESGEGEGSGASMGGGMSSLLPQALSQGVMSGGGLGLAAQLTQEIEGVQGGSAADTAGLTGAAAGSQAASSSGLSAAPRSTTGGTVA